MVRPWTEEELVELNALKDAGKTNKEIAKKLRRSQSAVTTKIHNIGLHLRNGAERLIRKKCLRCREYFMTADQFIFMCRGCKKRIAETY